MNGFSPAPASAPSPTEPTSSTKRSWTILGRLTRAVREQNWFAVGLEVLIVVLGVVIGFQITAWGQSRTDRAQEQEYLRQLAADLLATEQMVAEADSALENEQHPAATRLLQSWGSTERPPRDSVLVWVRAINSIYTVRPVLGTAESLVATGDLTLLSDRLLRTEITVYLDLTQDHLESMAEVGDWSRQALVEIGKHFDFLDPVRMGSESDRRDRGRIIAGLSPAGDWASPFPLDVEAFYADQEVYNWVYLVAGAHHGRAMRREYMREEAAALRQRVEAQITP